MKRHMKKKHVKSRRKKSRRMKSRRMKSRGKKYSGGGIVDYLEATTTTRAQRAEKQPADALAAFMNALKSGKSAFPRDGRGTDSMSKGWVQCSIDAGATFSTLFELLAAADVVAADAEVKAADAADKVVMVGGWLSAANNEKNRLGGELKQLEASNRVAVEKGNAAEVALAESRVETAAAKAAFNSETSRANRLKTEKEELQGEWSAANNEKNRLGGELSAVTDEKDDLQVNLDNATDENTLLLGELKSSKQRASWKGSKHRQAQRGQAEAEAAVVEVEAEGYRQAALNIQALNDGMEEVKKLLTKLTEDEEARVSSVGQLFWHLRLVEESGRKEDVGAATAELLRLKEVDAADAVSLLRDIQLTMVNALDGLREGLSRRLSQED